MEWTAETLEQFRTSTHSLHREGCMTLNELGEMLGYKQTAGNGGRLANFVTGREQIPAHTQAKLNDLLAQRQQGMLLRFSGEPDYEYLKNQLQQYPEYSTEQLQKINPVVQACLDMYGGKRKGCNALALILDCKYQSVQYHQQAKKLPRGKELMYLRLYLEAVSRRLKACQQRGELETLLNDAQAQRTQLIDLDHLQQAASQRGLAWSTGGDLLQAVASLNY